MQAQIVHEAEIHRQHVRLRIPIAIEIDGTRYTVDDWSVGGFGVAGPMASRRSGERFPARLIFPFEDFELSLRLDCQLVYVLADESRFGGRFLSLSQGQADLFRYLVDAYLSGELVSGGDILAVVARDNSGEARVRRLFEGLGQEETRGRRVRRILGSTLLVLVGLGLAALIAAGIYERYLVVTTDRAVIEAPFYRLEATATGRVEAAGQGLLHPGDPAARVVGQGGTAVPLASPCECVIDTWLVPPGRTVQVGGLVATLVAADQPLTVRAEVPLDRARRLRVGQTAEVTVPGKAEPYRGQIERIDFRLKSDRPGEPVRLEDSSRQMVPVVIRPDRPFDFDDLGYAVSVRFF
ncbi:HlyD family efflux transporter periplasmic adaptor subunit [Benzoatithermus flavus]|uniref:Alginate biosynthesis protein Alg44 n=1 Tax=Benzoatithermus flavus TaxID=3108223 RepID=A0ABU8XWR9_9PROT